MTSPTDPTACTCGHARARHPSYMACGAVGCGCAIYDPAWDRPKTEHTGREATHYPGDGCQPAHRPDPALEPIISEGGTTGFPDDHLDEFIAHGVNFHFEVMNDCDFWMSITYPDGRAWDINCGSVTGRAKGYARCEPQQ